MKNANLNNEQLVILFEQGNRKAYKEIYESYVRPVHQYIFRIINDRVIAEDITADTFVKLWDHYDDMESLPHLVNWLYLTARNAAIDRRRTLQLQNDAYKEIEYLSEASEEAIDFAIIDAEIIREMRNQIEALPDKCKTIIKLVRKGKTTREISSELGISQQTVLNQKNTGLKKLKAAALKTEWAWLFIIDFSIKMIKNLIG